MAFRITRKPRFLGFTLLGLLLLYAALGFWVMPSLLRAQIEDFSAKHWQRKPMLGDISFNPFTLALEVRGFAFQDSRAAPLLSFDRLLVNLDLSSLWRRGLSLHAIELDNPSARVLVRADGSLNLSELTAPFAAPPGAPPATGSESHRLFIDRLQLRNGAFEFEDQARATPFRARLTPVNFELLDFSTTGDTDNRYALQATSTAGEQLRWNGSLALSPLGSKGQFELTDVRARTLWSYLQESLAFEISDGLVALSGGYEFAATEPALTLGVNLARVDVKALKIRPRGGDLDWVSLDHLALADTHVDLAGRKVSVARLHLEAGTVQVERDAQGRINLSRLLTAPASDPTPDAPTSASAGEAPWTVSVPEVSIAGLRLIASDSFVKPAAAITLSPVNLQLRGFSTAPGQHLELDANLAVESGGRLAIRGQGIPADNSFTGKIKVDELNLAAMQPYVGTYTQMTLLSGLLSTELDAEYSPAALRLAGNLDCVKLHTVDNALREDFIKWERLTLTGIDYRTATAGRPDRLNIASIAARSPYVRLIIAPDQTTNIDKVLAQPASAPGPVQTIGGAGPPTGRQDALAMSIGKVQVVNGSANFADFWITPNYAVSLQQLDGSITGLSSRKDSRARLSLSGKIDRYAPVEIGGELNLLSASLYTDLRVKFSGVELTSVTPYSGRFAGYRIEKGKLSVDVRYQVENRQLNAEQRFIVDQLTLGERVDSPDAVKLPLRLAVALLKDRNGVIDLGLPVSGSLDDPKFRVGPIIWKAFVNLLAGVATSPFKLLGGMFGGGEEVNLIDFAPGSAALEPAAAEKLAALAKALRERPQLALEVPATYSPDADFAVLASSALDSRLASFAQGRKPSAVSLADPAHRFETLCALYKVEKPGAALPPAALTRLALRVRERDLAGLDAANAELESALRPTLDSMDPALQVLAQRRARAVQDALLSSGEVEPARVFMLAPGAAPASDGRVRLSLSLK